MATIAKGKFAGDVLVVVATFALANCLRVSAVTSIRPIDLGVPYRVMFFDYKVQCKYITARTGRWGAASCKRLGALVARKPSCLPIFSNMNAILSTEGTSIPS